MKLLTLGIMLVSALWSCNNDLELFTEPVDLPFVYGIIESNDTTHYIKVTRTFQKFIDDVNVNDLYYENDSINVYIDEYSGGDLIYAHQAFPVEGNDKEEGIFPHPIHKYYKISGTLLSNKLDHRYSIRVELTNGEHVENKEPFALQRNIGVNKPKLELPDAIVEIGFKDLSGNPAPYKFHWGQSGGGREELILTVVFLETNIETNTTDTVTMPVVVYNDIPTDKHGNAIELLGLRDLFDGMAKHLEKSKTFKRRMLNTQIEYIGAVKEVVGFGVGMDIWSESRDLTTYETIMYSQTQDGISQDIPNFSNLSNAVGMFSTRSHKAMPATSNYLYFNTETLDSFACSPFFYEYNFARSYINSQGELEFDHSSDRCK